MKKLGVRIAAASENKALVERRTSESEVRVEVEFGKRKRCGIRTPVEFLNHMLQTIAWNCGFNLKLRYRAKNYKLSHVVFEDTGICLGRALREVMVRRIAASGANARGANVRGLVADLGILDEAGALVGVSFEGRPEFNFVSLNRVVRVKEILSGNVEDARACDLDDFLKGLALGMGATLNVYLLSGEDNHHIWESVFRGVGAALAQAFEKNEFRKGACAGVKETIW
ncbi:MAG: hypothetical protein AB1468_04000 [Candidatus Micrarchaeota archaeon]